MLPSMVSQQRLRTTKIYDFYPPNRKHMGPLINWIPSHRNLEVNCPLKDMVRIEGNWSLDFFRIWVSKNISRCIVSVPPLRPGGGLDQISWLPNSTRTFSIKSAYRPIRENHWNSKALEI